MSSRGLVVLLKVAARMMTDDRLYLAHLIARDLGGMTVAEMSERMSFEEFREHEAFYQRRNAETQIHRKGR